MIAIPSEIIDVIDLNNEYPVPALKNNATNKQKIIYADFINELMKNGTCDHFSFDKPFFKH